MGLPVEVNNLMLGSLGGYTVGRSLRFRSSASAYLNRTMGSPNRTTATFSFWVKRGNLTSAYNAILFATNWNSGINFDGGGVTDTLQILDASNSAGSTYYVDIRTTQVFRDPSAWYHLVITYDTTNATASDRIRLYVNGVRVTAFQTATYPSQNQQLNLFSVSEPWRIGSRGWGSTFFFDGYLAEFNYIDGQALTPSSFGAYDTNGVWQPKKYSGTYGTNGFYLNFSDNSAATAAAIGKDSSGNGNNWTPNNISVTAGTTYDSMIDSPTPYADGGNGRGNYAVLNPLDKNTSSTLSNANLTSASGTTTWYGVRSTIGITSGKWYWEVTSVSHPANTALVPGIADATATLTFPGATANGYGYWSNAAGQSGKYNNNSLVAYGVAYVQGDVIGVAFDADAGTLTFYVNGSSQGTAFTGIPANTYFPMVGNYSTTTAINFGQRPFSYTPPSGYKALNTYNLPAPSIANGAQYFAATTYTGNGTSQSISNAVNGVSFQPDAVWYKIRSTTDNHLIFDSIRGTEKYLSPNLTIAEGGTGNGTLTAFNSNGFSVGTNVNGNANGSTFVAWQWKGGGTAVTNNSGTISSQVSANTSAGISITTYTGSGANATVGHGLGVAPSMIIFKRRDNTGNWAVYHTSVGNTAALYMNLTAAPSVNSVFFNNTSPTSSVFSIGTGTDLNVSGSTNVAYCFSSVSGYSAFGKYTGNGSTDGPFTYLGFRPRFIMIKRTDTTMNWYIFDTSRDTYNVEKARLFPNLSDAESTNADFADYLSNGFKLRSSDISWNASGGTYIYAAFAEHPFQASRAR